MTGDADDRRCPKPRIHQGREVGGRLMDRQSEAFQAAEPGDWSTDEVLAGAVVHEPDSTEPIADPAEWDARGWDTDREPPKTLTEAQALLATRIADPDAPDDHTVAGAYDQLEGE